MKLGAHVTIAKGYEYSLQKLHKMGGNCLQIFSTTPRGWRTAQLSDQTMARFVSLKSKLNITPIYFHASYLINLADEGIIGRHSISSIISELSIAPKLHIKGCIVHLGSYKGNESRKKYKALVVHIKEILASTPKETLFIIENAGNNKIGKDIKEIAKIIKDVKNPRVRVCLDTCHLFSAGYDLSTPAKIGHFLKEFNREIGLDRLELFHFNDSKDPFRSGRDRHENIGKGTIPIDEFRYIMTHRRLKHLPFIIETPGFHDEGPDKKNLDILKSLV